jgi:hypothetical protein
MAVRLFLFVQMEFPWELGPADGRYVLRGKLSGEPEHVVGLDTVGAVPRRKRTALRRKRQASLEPAEVATARATIIDPVPVSAELQARKWLEELDPERETDRATVALNRVIFAHRLAGADAYLRELSASQALVIRAGWGIGEEVAGGRFSHARELPRREGRARRRVAALRPQERLALILNGTEQTLLCEEHTLRARLDLDQGRVGHAAIELFGAYSAALVELKGRADLALRVAELRELGDGVTQLAQEALPDNPAQPDVETLRHALERLEAALRARTAAGWNGRT